MWRTTVWLLPLACLSALAGCFSEDGCDGHYTSCEVDEECQGAGLPPGRCLDDRATGRVCGFYYDICPTKLRWYACAGNGETKSPLADYCVRPEYLPDLGTDAAPAQPDMSTVFDSSGPD